MDTLLNFSAMQHIPPKPTRLIATAYRIRIFAHSQITSNKKRPTDLTMQVWNVISNNFYFVILNMPQQRTVSAATRKAKKTPISNLNCHQIFVVTLNYIQRMNKIASQKDIQSNRLLLFISKSDSVVVMATDQHL